LLEFEIRASAIFAQKGIELPVAVIVKKPVQLTHNLEFMIGIGPEMVRASNAIYGGLTKGAPNCSARVAVAAPPVVCQLYHRHE